MISEATELLTRAARHRRPGPYQLQAAIVACHVEAKSWQDTDWPQIVILYDMLLCLAASPVTRLHRAIALRYVSDAEKALAELDSIDLNRYHLYHATRVGADHQPGRAGTAGAAPQALTAATRSTMPSLSRSCRCTTKPACSTNGSGRRVW
jgi:predicted RNA polymerase sigma factor